ncbi:MFS transporter [Rhizorhabdus dicambivorans]|uniref:MFS transporter n=1 Tax=Rhizorhabdus dicambivorans TaxID=1850238 RepID=UPI0020D16899|nr:MFS transporter [Rhizorhabdus dicambivorans]
MQAEGKDSRRGWLVAAGATLGISVSVGPIPIYTIGMFAPILSDAFGWSFVSLMSVVAIQSAILGVTAPAAGVLVDRYGARPVGLVSLALFGICYASLAFTPGSIWIFYLQWVVMTIAGLGTLTVTWAHGVTGWFDRNRGLALGIASAGPGLTGVIIKPLTAWLLQSFGWQTAFLAIGAIPIVIGVPLVALLFREASPTMAADPAITAPAIVSRPGLTVRQAASTRQFSVMIVAILLLSFALTAPLPNLENMLRSLKFDLPTVARIAAMFGGALMAGRLMGGWLLDRLWAPLCGMMIFLLPAAGGLLLARPVVSEWEAWVGVAAIGFGTGFELDLIAYLVSRYFGQRQFGTLYGGFFAVSIIGGGLGTVLYGYAFDKSGTYSLILQIGSVALVAGGGLLLLLMGPYPKYFENEFERS